MCEVLRSDCVDRCRSDCVATTKIFTDAVNSMTPISFSKFGDGEIFCMLRVQPDGSNCDGDKYTSKLAEALVKSFQYLVDESSNAYIGKWHSHAEYHNKLANLVSKPIRWADYHSILFDRHDDGLKVDLYRSIQLSSAKKILVCNQKVAKAGVIFGAEVVVVPERNWFDVQFNDILSQVRGLLTLEKGGIVLTACGQSAKVLIAELTREFPKGIYLDFGSALDKLCLQHDTREYQDRYTYRELLSLLGDVIPMEWHNNIIDKLMFGVPRWSELVSRIPLANVNGKMFFQMNPGREHYKLLAFLSMKFDFATIFDLGTAEGLSALSLAWYNKTNRVYTFDIGNFDVECLKGLENVVMSHDNLWSSGDRQKWQSRLLNSSIIFMDVDPHNGHMEWDLYEFLKLNHYDGLLICDDILHFQTMRDHFWNRIPSFEKLDLTFVGHWSGTGVISFNSAHLTELCGWLNIQTQ